MAWTPLAAAASLDACRAVVAARLPRRPRRALLRRLRVLDFAGAALDDPEAIARAATEAGIEPADSATGSREHEVEAALRADMGAARSPSPASRAQDYKLGGPRGAPLHVPVLRAASAPPRRRRTGRPRTASTCRASARSRPTRRRSPTSRPSSPAGPIRRRRTCSSGRGAARHRRGRGRDGPRCRRRARGARARGDVPAGRRRRLLVPLACSGRRISLHRLARTDAARRFTGSGNHLSQAAPDGLHALSFARRCSPSRSPAVALVLLAAAVLKPAAGPPRPPR